MVLETTDPPSDEHRQREILNALIEPTLNNNRLCSSGFSRMPHDDSFLPFGDARDSDSDSHSTNDLPPELRRAGRDAYRRGWESYREADCPFGLEDKAMLVWFSFNRGSAQNAFTVGKN